MDFGSATTTPVAIPTEEALIPSFARSWTVPMQLLKIWHCLLEAAQGIDIGKMHADSFKLSRTEDESQAIYFTARDAEGAKETPSQILRGCRNPATSRVNTWGKCQQQAADDRTCWTTGLLGQMDKLVPGAGNLAWHAAVSHGLTVARFMVRPYGLYGHSRLLLNDLRLLVNSACQLPEKHTQILCPSDKALGRSPSSSWRRERGRDLSQSAPKCCIRWAASRCWRM
jgi:hypothetical protein